LVKKWESNQGFVKTSDSQQVDRISRQQQQPKLTQVPKPTIASRPPSGPGVHDKKQLRVMIEWNGFPPVPQARPAKQTTQ